VAVAVLYEFRGMTQDHYDRFIQEAYQGEPMPGVITHAAGPSEEGWWAFDVYESQDAADAIGPPAIERLREMGVTEAPAVRTFEVHNALTS
jgi:hypothetical protein